MAVAFSWFNFYWWVLMFLVKYLALTLLLLSLLSISPKLIWKHSSTVRQYCKFGQKLQKPVFTFDKTLHSYKIFAKKQNNFNNYYGVLLRRIFFHIIIMMMMSRFVFHKYLQVICLRFQLKRKIMILNKLRIYIF